MDEIEEQLNLAIGLLTLAQERIEAGGDPEVIAGFVVQARRYVVDAIDLLFSGIVEDIV